MGLLAEVHAACRQQHFARSTEQVYCRWVEESLTQQRPGRETGRLLNGCYPAVGGSTTLAMQPVAVVEDHLPAANRELCATV